MVFEVVPLTMVIIILCYITIAIGIFLYIRMYIRSLVKTCEASVNMADKVVIVTGANAGLGLETAKGLAMRGARVILACRNESRGTQARDQIIAETNHKDVVFKHLDLASLASVRAFCQDIYKTEQRLDVLVNNAGVYNLSNQHTADGIVEEMQVNVFGPFLLTLLLLPLLERSKPSRIVNLSSVAHLFANYSVDKLNKEGEYSPVTTYNNAKLCCLIFTVELERRLRGTGVVANAAHPGIIYTNIVEGKRFSAYFFKASSWFFYRTVYEGAQTSIYLAVAKECENVSGKLYADCSEFLTNPKARNDEVGLQFWQLAIELVKYDGKDIPRKSESYELSPV